MAFTFGTGGSGFGAPQQPAFSQFQQAAAPAPAFGVQSFGAQPNAPAFGAQGMGGAQGFATPAPNQFAAAGAGFGTGFGAQPNAPAFGASGLGGAQGFVTPATGQFGAQGASGFGQAATTLPQGSAFGAPAQQGGFGATGYAAPQAGFAAAAPAIGFGNQGSGFGAAPAPNAFGASSFNAAPASGGFGATSFGAGAAPASFNAGGTVGFQSQAYGAQNGFSKQAGDKGDGNQVTNSICAKMIDQSLESQRFKDYSTGNKGGQPSGFGMAGAGGVPAPFSQQSSAFLPTTTGFQIGQQQTNPSPFGLQQPQQPQQQAQPAFGSPFGVAGKVTTPANSTSNPFGAPGGAAMPFAANTGGFMQPATAAGNPFGGGFPTTAASSTSLFPSTTPFGTAPAASGAFANPAPFSFGNTPANNTGLNLQSGGLLNNFAPANPSAPAAPAPVSVITVSAPASEAKYADVFSSRIELEDREGGHRHDSVVYARHHNIPLSRDQPPTLIWQSSSKTTKSSTPMNAGNATPRRAGTASSALYRDVNLINRDEATVKPDNSDSVNRMKALELLHRSILPFWNRHFYSCKPWCNTEVDDPNKDEPDIDCNCVTKFSLCVKHPLGEKKIIPSYSVHSLQIFDDNKVYFLHAESKARRRIYSGKEDDAWVVKDVPVDLIMTVEGPSFSMLLDMIVRKYGSRGFSPKDVADEDDHGDFFPFEICFEYETPQSYPKEKQHVPCFYDGSKSLDGHFYGFPCAHKQLSGTRYFSHKHTSDLLSLQQPLSHNFPRLYLSVAFSNILNTESGGKKYENSMDLQFVAVFHRKKLEEFDDSFKYNALKDQDSSYEKFLEDFHQYFEEQLKSSSFGDKELEEKEEEEDSQVVPVVRTINSLERMGPHIEPKNRFIEALKTDPQQRGMSSCIWRFWVTQKI